MDYSLQSNTYILQKKHIFQNHKRDPISGYQREVGGYVSDRFTRFSNDIYDAVLTCGFTRIQILVILYVIRKTDGWNKPAGDYISITRMAKDIGVERSNASKTVKKLFSLGVLEVYEGEKPTSIKLIRVTSPSNWELPCVVRDT